MTFRNKAFLLFTFFLIAFYFIRIYPPASPTDTYYYLAVGRQVFNSRQMPQGDNFTYGVNSSKITSTWWLSGLVFYLFYHFLWGNFGIITLRLLTTIATLFTLFITFRIFDKQGKLSIILLTIAAFVMAVRINDRPEIFSFLFISVTNYFCIKYFFTKKYSILGYMIPFIFLLWPSFHGFVSIGLVIFAFWAGLIFLENRFFLKQTAENYQKFLLTFFASAVVTLIQHQRLTTFTLERKFQVILSEWISLKQAFISSGPYLLLEPSVTIFPLFGLIFLILFLVFLKNNIKNKNSYIYVFIYVFYFAIFLSPIEFVRLIQVQILIFSPILLFLIINTPKNIAKKMVTWMLVASYAIMLVFMVPTYFNRGFFDNQITLFLKEKISKLPIVSYWGPDFPTKTPQIINGYLDSKRIFTSNYWNSYLIWETPKAKVYSDVIFENTTAQDITNEFSIAQGDKGWTDLLNTYKIDTVINSQPDTKWGNFTPVYKLNNWKLVYLDSISAVYAREDIIKSTPLDLSAIHPELPTDMKFLPKEETKAVNQLKNLLIFDPTNEFARIQLIMYYQNKNIELANELAIESRTLIPKSPWFSYFLTSINAKQNNCKLAVLYGKESVQKSYQDSHIRDLVKTVTSKCPKH